MRHYYGVVRSPNYLEHYGVKGMKWGKHLFGKYSQFSMRNVMETDTGTRANNQNGSDSHMTNYFAERDKRNAQRRAEVMAKREAAAAAAAAEAAEKEKSKKKSSGSKSKGGSSKSSEKKEENKDKNALPDSLVEKLKNPQANLTQDEVRTRATKGTKKAKELLKKLPKNFTMEDIDDLWDNESDQRGVGYDAYVLEIATYTAETKYYDKLINDSENRFSKSKDTTEKQQLRVYINSLKKKRQTSEYNLKYVLKTGHSIV